MANDLITIDEYKQLMNITSDKDNERLDALISSASALVKTYCGRTFVDYASVDKTEVLNIAEDTHIAQLVESPVTSVTSVEIRSTYAEAYSELTEADFEFFLDLNTDSIYRTNGTTGYTNWPYGPGSVKVLYKGGFISVPEDLKLAVVDLVTYYYKNEYKGTQNMSGSTSRTPSTTTQSGNVSFPDHIKRVLDLYKNL